MAMKSPIYAISDQNTGLEYDVALNSASLDLKTNSEQSQLRCEILELSMKSGTRLSVYSKLARRTGFGYDEVISEAWIVLKTNSGLSGQRQLRKLAQVCFKKSKMRTEFGYITSTEDDEGNAIPLQYLGEEVATDSVEQSLINEHAEKEVTAKIDALDPITKQKIIEFGTFSYGRQCAVVWGVTLRRANQLLKQYREEVAELSRNPEMQAQHSLALDDDGKVLKSNFQKITESNDSTARWSLKHRENNYKKGLACSKKIEVTPSQLSIF